MGIDRGLRGHRVTNLGDQILIRLARISIVFLLLLPLNAAPLGLGDINLESALNQPLDARISLTAVGQTRIEDISVRLASREAFTQAGLERPLFLSDLKFAIERDGTGTPVVRIRSGQAIVEPFLDFLVEVNWPNGRLLREYTVLLDPPLLLDEAPVPVAAPAAAPAPVVAQSTPARTAAPAAAAQRPGPQVQQSADGAWSYGPVARDATLWSIAQELRGQDTSYSVEQIMMALLRSNPDAFYNGNVNELKAGYVLRIDDPALIGAMSQAAALAETRRQTSQWMDAKRGAADRATNRPQAAEPAPVAASNAGAAASSGPLLRLSAPDKADVDRLAAGAIEGESESGAAEHLRQELTEALEVSESTRQENIELRQRLVALEEQIASMQRLLTLQEDTLASMQGGAAPAAQADQPRRDGNPFAALLNDPMMLGVAGAGVLLLLTLGWLVARRRRIARASLEEFTVPAPFSGGQTASAAPMAGMAAAGGAAGAGLIVAEDDEAGRTVATAADGDETDVMQAEEDEIDILAEADVYLAYRRIDKAEELLKEAIKADPERTDLRLKLLEVYAAGGDTDAFVLQSEVLRASLGERDASLWDKVVAMGKRLAPEHSLFAAGAVGLAAKAAESAVVDNSVDPELAGFDFEAFGRSLENSDDNAAHSHAFSAHNETGGDLDFNLDEDTLARLGDTAGGNGDDTWLGGSNIGAGDAVAVADEALLATADVAGNNGLDTFDLDHAVDEADADGRRPGSLGDMLGMPAQVAAVDTVQAVELDDSADENELELGSDIDWLSAVGEELAAFESDGLADGEDFSDLISGTDEVGTKLDLAKAYIDMGDGESARSILSEVSSEGSEDQQREASALMRQIG